MSKTKIEDFGSEVTSKRRLGEGMFLALDEFLKVLGDITGKNASEMIMPETNVSKTVFSSKSNSMMTLFQINGVSTILSKSDFNQMVNDIESKLSPYLGKKGYYMQFVMNYNPQKSKREVNKSIAPMKNTANTVGLDFDFIFDDWGNKLSEWTSYEKVYLAVWTRPNILTSHNLKTARKEQISRKSNTSLSIRAMDVSAYLPSLVNYHSSYVSGVETALEAGGIIFDKLDCHKALWEMRSEIDSAATSPGWMPILKGDEIMPRIKNRIDNQFDLENVLYSKIGNQVVPRDPEDLNSTMVQIGEELHHPLTLKVPSQDTQSFNALLSVLINKNFPWRLSFGINGGAPNFGIKGFLAGIFAKTSIDNKLIRTSLNYLNRQAELNRPLVEFRASFDTWVYAHEEGAEQKLKSQASELLSAIQSWGNAEVSDVVGHPTLGVMSTIPGALDYIPSQGAGAPLTDVIKMMPLTRPASPWERGSTPYRTPCGKLFPYQQGSSLQAAWVDIGFAPMGYGKSVQINTLNWSFLIEPGSKSLPWISMLDIGPSSRGMVNLILAGLPEGEKHLAVYHKLRMNEKNAVNLMDIPLGLRKPFTSQKTFLVNLFCLFATPIGKDSAPDGIDDIASRAIDLAYENASDEFTPKTYKPGVYSDVDEMLEKLDYKFDEDSTWWEVVDFLFEKGHIYLASKAQRRAMPILLEVANAAKHPTIVSLYNHKIGDENIVNYFWRNCIKAINNYSILKGYTQLDLSEARVVSLDLSEVATAGSEVAIRQTAVMYMAGRHLVASKFFFMPEDAEEIESEPYREFHRAKIASLRDDPKRLSYDEVHRITKAVSSSSATQQIVSDITTAIRESRKWKLHIGLYSQEIDDIPPVIRNLATTIYILGVGSKEELDKVGEVLGLSAAEKNAVRTINKPGSAGSTFLGVFKTSKGEIKQKLMNTLGSVMLWGFSSTSDDNKIREFLVERIGIREALKALSKLYPGGTVDSEVNRRKLKYSESGKQVDIVIEIAEEVYDIYNRSLLSDK